MQFSFPFPASPLSAASPYNDSNQALGFLGKAHEGPEQSTVRGWLREATWIRSPMAAQIAVAISRPNGFTWWPFIHGADISRTLILAGAHSTERWLADLSILSAPGYRAGQKIIQQPSPYTL